MNEAYFDGLIEEFTNLIRFLQAHIKFLQQTLSELQSQVDGIEE